MAPKTRLSKSPSKATGSSDGVFPSNPNQVECTRLTLDYTKELWKRLADDHDRLDTKAAGILAASSIVLTLMATATQRMLEAGSPLVINDCSLKVPVLALLIITVLLLMGSIFMCLRAIQARDVSYPEMLDLLTKKYDRALESSNPVVEYCFHLANSYNVSNKSLMVRISAKANALRCGLILLMCGISIAVLLTILIIAVRLFAVSNQT